MRSPKPKFHQAIMPTVAVQSPGCLDSPHSGDIGVVVAVVVAVVAVAVVEKSANTVAGHFENTAVYTVDSAAAAASAGIGWDLGCPVVPADSTVDRNRQ